MFITVDYYKKANQFEEIELSGETTINLEYLISVDFEKDVKMACITLGDVTNWFYVTEDDANRILSSINRSDR